MPTLAVAFSFPLVLTALAGLPLLYLLLRITPPRPAQIPFPPLRLILNVRPTEETAAQMPWWLLLLRLVLASLLIVAMAGPIWHPLSSVLQKGPLMILIDNGWPAAPDWDRRTATASRRILAAAQRSSPVAVVVTSDGARDISALDPQKALERLQALKPVPVMPSRRPVLAAIEKFAATHAKPSLLWVADGVEDGDLHDFATKLEATTADVTLVTDPRPARALAAARNEASHFDVRVLSAGPATKDGGIVRALDSKGLALGEARFDFAGQKETTAEFNLPVELRNDIARLEIAGEHSAGAVFLLDERWRRRRIGLFSSETTDVAQPLLSPSYYLTKALAPFADVAEASPSTDDPVRSLLDTPISTLILADVGVVPDTAYEALTRFVEAGGVLVRFAGTHLAAASDDLVPVRLRRGGRFLGGAMSWDSPKTLAPFSRESPFFGLTVPAEVTVSRQVLAEPDPGLAAKSWAQLSDGTPLVTAERRGKGLIVLFHVTADTTWSNLPLSGLFVDMLRKLVALSGETAQEDAEMPAAQAAAGDPAVAALAPQHALDGFGSLGPPPPEATPIAPGFQGPVTLEHPPGFYGPTDGVVALNALSPNDHLVGADYPALGLHTESMEELGPIDLQPWLLAAAFLLFAADGLAAHWLAGGLRGSAGARLTAGVLIAGLFLVGVPPARAAEAAGNAPADLASALKTRLAYVASGDARVDEVTRLGLLSLSRILAQRTSLSPGEPAAVDPARDELSFYPLLYWPIVATRPQPPREAVAKAAAFMKQGGTIVFDTRDALTARPDGPPTPEGKWLKSLLEGVDVPQLEPIPADHVVTKTFYLLDGFIGRYTSGISWIEALPPAPADDAPRPARAGDSVSPIVITSNDLAAGWASDADGESLYSLVPGGERQHELALRGGVNLVMYTLTGNYKSDQVHVKDLLDRLAH